MGAGMHRRRRRMRARYGQRRASLMAPALRARPTFPKAKRTMCRRPSQRKDAFLARENEEAGRIHWQMVSSPKRYSSSSARWRE